MIDVLEFVNRIPKIDNWEADPSTTIFTTTKNFIIAPVSQTLQLVSESLDLFLIRSKKCYNNEVLRTHFCRILNYFEAFFDTEKEYLSNMSRIKYMIDFIPMYDKASFIRDLRVYILGNSIKSKVGKLIEYNYQLDLKYSNISAPLQYNNTHAKYLLEMSILMDLVIPLITHFGSKKRVEEIDELLLDVYDIILYMFPGDMFSKMYETSYSNVGKSEYKNAPLWDKQDIRGKDVVTHSRDNVDNIMLNIMPKYAFDRNVVALNYTSIHKNTGCQITDIGYEYSYVSLSSSKRDGDENSSEFDKYESSIVKNSEAIYLQSKVNSAETIKTIDSLFGPFSDEEIVFYREKLRNSQNNYINNFQKQLIFNIFYKYFGDPQAIYAIKRVSTDYIKLMLAAKKILMNNYMIIMPYVISGKVEKIVTRKTINKREEREMKVSPYYPHLLNKYRDERIIQQILSTFATVISSTFRIVDFDNPELDGKIIDTIPSIVLEELQLMSLLV